MWAYRDSITTLSDTALYQAFVWRAERLGRNTVKLRCECLLWTHEGLTKAAFETGRCPICGTSMLALGNEIVLECAATNGIWAKSQAHFNKVFSPSPRRCWLHPAAGSSEDGPSRDSKLAFSTWSFHVRAGSTSTVGVILGVEREPFRDHSGASSCGAVLSNIHELSETLLHSAGERWSMEMVALLLDNESELSAQDRKGKSALHIAVGQLDKQIVSLLVGRGAEVNLVNERGCTLLH